MKKLVSFALSAALVLSLFAVVPGAVPGASAAGVDRLITVTAGVNGSLRVTAGTQTSIIPAGSPTSITVPDGETVTFMAMPDFTYTLKSLTVGGTDVGTAYHTMTVTADIAVAATFVARDSYTEVVDKCGCGSATPSTPWTCAGGTSNIPPDAIPISDAKELAEMAQNSKNKYYYLTNDITLTGQWVPIEKFNGSVFDGNCFTISGLRVQDGGVYAGLFGNISRQNVTIKNLKIVVDTEGVSAARKTGACAGALAGRIGKNVNIENCHVKGATTVSAISSTQYAGGLVGRVGRNVKIENCTSTIDVFSNLVAGGLIGRFDGGKASAVRMCYVEAYISTKTVTYKYDHGKTGGLIGECRNTAEITSCYVKSAVASSNFAGGLIGWGGKELTIQDCAVDIEAISSISGFSLSAYVGGLVGRIDKNSSIRDCDVIADISAYATSNAQDKVKYGALVGFVKGTKYKMKNRIVSYTVSMPAVKTEMVSFSGILRTRNGEKEIVGQGNGSDGVECMAGFLPPR